MISNTPKPPCYAIIFTSKRTVSDNGYSDMAERMEQLVREQKGFLGFKSARNDIGISVSYWKDLDSISAWKQNVDHLEAQQKGRSEWYKSYKVRIAKVESDYGFEK